MRIAILASEAVPFAKTGGLADVASAETQLDRRRKAARSDKSLAAEVGALERAVGEL